VVAWSVTYLTLSDLRGRGWTDAMVREYLGEPDATRPNPVYRSAAPVRLYLAERAEAAQAIPAWAERKARAARRSATGVAVAGRKRAETEELAGQLATELTARLVLPADLRQAAIVGYNKWHAHGCTCPDWRTDGFCDKRADASDALEFLRRITINYVRHTLTGYDDAYGQLARRVGHQDAHELLRAKVNAAIAAKLDGLHGAGSSRTLAVAGPSYPGDGGQPGADAVGVDGDVHSDPVE
jgi:hypothetical protein